MLTTEFEHLQKVRGRSDDHLNDVLFSQVSHATGTVVYFGGDGMETVCQHFGVICK